MYICICKGITDSQIRQVVSDGATTLADVRQQLGAASKCGKCACLVDSVINEARADSPSGMYYAAS
jgi:bacterioferritin-associated ferredoxin